MTSPVPAADRFDLLELDTYRAPVPAVADDSAARFDLLELDPLPAGPAKTPAAPVAVPAAALAPVAAPVAPAPVAVTVAPPATVEYRRLPPGVADTLWGVSAPAGSVAGARLIARSAAGNTRAVYLTAPCPTVPTGPGLETWAYTTVAPVAPAAPVVAAPPAPAPVAAVEPPAPATAPVVNFGSIRRVPDAAAVAAAAARDREVSAALAARVSGELVAGAEVEGSGSLVSWSGHGEISRTDLLALLAAVGAASWAPAPRSAHAYAAAAVASLGTSYTVRATRAPTVTEVSDRGKPVTRILTVEERGWSARWAIGRVAGEGAVGDAYGRIALVVSLLPDGATLDVTGPTELADAVRAEFARLAAGEVLAATTVTTWLAASLKSAGSVKLGRNWYVPSASRKKAEAVTAALEAVWGSDWLNVPVATSAQLVAGLAKGLTAEVDAVLAKADEGDGARRTATLLGDLRDVGERARSYAAILGDAATKVVRDRIAAAIAEVTASLDPAALRGIALELD